MNIHIIHHFDEASLGLLRRLTNLMAELIEQREEDLFMGVKEQLNDILTDVREQKTLLEGVSTYIAGLKAQIEAALADKLDDADKAKLTEIFDLAEANRQATADALAANSPA